MQYTNESMGLTKTTMFTDRVNGIANIAKAIAHPARIAILQHMFNEKTCICGELVEEIGLAQATISQHLKELKTAGLIKGNIEGTSVCYCIDEDNWTKMRDSLQVFFDQTLPTNNCC